MELLFKILFIISFVFIETYVYVFFNGRSDVDLVGHGTCNFVYFSLLIVRHFLPEGDIYASALGRTSAY